MEEDRSITVHQRNLQYLMTEMYKIKNGLNPAFMREIFCQQESQYNLRNSNDFSLPRIKTVTYGSETIRTLQSYLGKVDVDSDSTHIF